MAEPTVTLLMPNRNNERVLGLMLERLHANTTYPSFELIVVDDGSTDRSRQILREWRGRGAFSDFTLIEKEHEAGGVVAALNAGLAAAQGELVVQLDGDATIETTGWLERMVGFHESDSRVGVVMPMVRFVDGQIHAAGVNIIGEAGLHDRGTRPEEPVGRRTLHSRLERTRVEDAGDLVEEPAETDASLGVCMLYARAMAEELGGYDPGFAPVWFDDLDLSLSARKLGLKVFFVPGIEVVHRIAMRNDRSSDTQSLRKRIRRAAAAVTPKRARVAVGRIERGGTGLKPQELKRVRHHYDYWRQKWGFDLINPDMDAVHARYGDTEVCWAYDAERREAGEEIVSAWKQSSLT
jgi:GT2 family glycosyltransferase